MLLLQVHWWTTIDRLNHLLLNVCRLLTIILTGVRSLQCTKLLFLLLAAFLLLAIFVFLLIVLVCISLILIVLALIIFSPIFIALYILSRHTPLLLLRVFFVVRPFSTISSKWKWRILTTRTMNWGSGSGLCDLILWVNFCYLRVFKLDTEIGSGFFVGGRLLLLGLWLLRVEVRRCIADSILLNKSGWQHEDFVGLCSFFTWFNLSCCHRD